MNIRHAYPDWTRDNHKLGPIKNSRRLGSGDVRPRDRKYIQQWTTMTTSKVMLKVVHFLLCLSSPCLRVLSHPAWMVWRTHTAPLLKPAWMATTSWLLPLCFETMLPICIVSNVPPRLDRHQFTFKAHRSTEDTNCTALYLALSLICSYVRLLLVDFCLACNNILPNRLETKASGLGLGI